MRLTLGALRRLLHESTRDPENLRSDLEEMQPGDRLEMQVFDQGREDMRHHPWIDLWVSCDGPDDFSIEQRQPSDVVDSDDEDGYVGMMTVLSGASVPEVFEYITTNFAAFQY